MSKFYEMDFEPDVKDYSNGHEDLIDLQAEWEQERRDEHDRSVVDKNSDRWGGRLSKLNEAFLKFCRGEITKEEYEKLERESERTETMASGTLGTLATKFD